MFNGLKAKRQLALYVALGVSTGGDCCSLERLRMQQM